MFFQSQARSKKPSRPTVSLVRPSARSLATPLAAGGVAAGAVAAVLGGRAERAEAELDGLRRRLAKVGLLLRDDREGADDD